MGRPITAPQIKPSQQCPDGVLSPPDTFVSPRELPQSPSVHAAEGDQRGEARHLVAINQSVTASQAMHQDRGLIARIST